MTVHSFRPTQLSVDDRMNMVWFDPNAELAMPHTCCAACGDECPTHTMAPIRRDETFHLYTCDYSLRTRDDLFCAECLDAINGEYQPYDEADDKLE